MHAALQGNLKDFGIADVFQLIGQQRKSGSLELSARGKRLEILFDRGAVLSAAPMGSLSGAAIAEMLGRCGYATRERVDALLRRSEASAETIRGLAVELGLISEAELENLERLLTRETLFEVLRWTGGTFDFKPGAIEHDRAYESMMGAEQILMEGLRMIDEWRSFEDLIPPEETVFRRVGDGSALLRGSTVQDPGFAERHQRVCQLIDGRLGLRRIIDLSRLGTFEAMRVIVALVRAGQIEPVAAVRGRGSSPVRAVAPARASSFLAAALPLLALVVVSLVTAQRSVLEERAPGTAAGSEVFRERIAIDASPLESVRAAFAQMRAQRAVEDFRMTTGRWPADWAELEAARLPLPVSLASVGSQPYYSVLRGQGVVLLAPER